MLIAVCALWFILCGMTITPTGGTFTVFYTEPIVNTDASAVTDLDHCNVYTQVSGQSQVKGSNITASAATGGGIQSPSVSVTWGAVPSTALPITFSITCTDTTGNETSLGSAITRVQTIDPFPLLVP